MHPHRDGEHRGLLAAGLSVTDHHAFLLQGLLSHIEFLDQQIARFDARIKAQTQPFAAALERLDTIPGIARRSAEQISPNSATT
jgi:transposase